MPHTAFDPSSSRRPPPVGRASHQPLRPRDWSGLTDQNILDRYVPGRADPMQVLEVLLKLHNQQHTARLKTLSHKTRQERADFLRRFFRDLRERAGYKMLNAELSRDFERRWSEPDGRESMVPGKEVLGRLNAKLQDEYGVTITDGQIAAQFSRNTTPADVADLLEMLQRFSATDPPEA